MPLPRASARTHIHTRRIECRGYEREDGLWDIEGHLVDTKTYSWHSDYRGEVAPGVPVHEMWLRLTIDDDFLIHDIVAASDYHPFHLCGSVAPAFASLKGLRIGPGWRREVRARVGGSKGCTHLIELLWPIATTAYQTIFPAREKRAREHGETLGHERRGRAELIDSCRALAHDSEVVKRYWPEHYRAD